MIAPALPKVTFEIDGETYTLTLLDGVTASDLFFEILDSVGGSFQQFKGASAGSVEAAGMALAGALIKGVGKSTLMKLRGLMLRNCTVTKEAASPKLDTVAAIHFAGRPAHMLLWFTICLKENFADFLDDGLLGKFQALIPASFLSKSPEGSTGSASSS
jgi:hypothetical protein